MPQNTYVDTAHFGPNTPSLQHPNPSVHSRNQHVSLPQNTYVDMAHFGPYIDAAMAAAHIPKVANPLPVTLKDAVNPDGQQ